MVDLGVVKRIQKMPGAHDVGIAFEGLATVWSLVEEEHQTESGDTYGEGIVGSAEVAMVFHGVYTAEALGANSVGQMREAEVHPAVHIDATGPTRWAEDKRGIGRVSAEEGDIAAVVEG